MNPLLVPVDFSDTTSPVLEEAKRMARAFHAEVVLFHIVAPEPAFVGFEAGPEVVRTAVARDVREDHRKLENLREGLEREGVKAKAIQVQGAIAEKIVEQAAKLNVSYIIMGSHGHGALYHLLVGSVTEGVLRSAPCPVLVVSHRAQNINPASSV